jgi:hypothetical protein
MKNRLLFLVAFFAAFTLTSPVLAQPPEADAKTEEVKADDTKVEEKAEAPAEEKAAPEAKAEDGDTEGKAATKEIETDEEAVEAASGLYTALANRDWALAIALGLTLLVFILRKVKVLAKVPSKAVPWVTAVLAMGGYVAAALMTPGVAIGPALMEGAAAGAAAVGLWEMLLKHFLGTKSEGGSGG